MEIKNWILWKCVTMLGITMCDCGDVGVTEVEENAGRLI